MFWLGVGLFSFWDGLVEILHSISLVHFESPVVDRQCFVLARQCRKKKKKS